MHEANPSFINKEVVFNNSSLVENFNPLKSSDNNQSSILLREYSLCNYNPEFTQTDKLASVDNSSILSKLKTYNLDGEYINDSNDNDKVSIVLIRMANTDTLHFYIKKRN